MSIDNNDFMPYIHYKQKDYKMYGPSFKKETSENLKEANKDLLDQIYLEKISRVNSILFKNADKNNLSNFVEQYNNMIDFLNQSDNKNKREDSLIDYDNLANRIAEKISEKYHINMTKNDLLSNKDSILNIRTSQHSQQPIGNVEIEIDSKKVSYPVYVTQGVEKILNNLKKNDANIIKEFIINNSKKKQDNRNKEVFVSLQNINNALLDLQDDKINIKDKQAILDILKNDLAIQKSKNKKYIIQGFDEGILFEYIATFFAKEINLSSENIGQEVKNYFTGVEVNNRIIKKIKADYKKEGKCDIKISGIPLSAKNFSIDSTKKDKKYLSLPATRTLLEMIEGSINTEKNYGIFFNSIVYNQYLNWDSMRNLFLLETASGAFQENSFASYFLIRNKNTGKILLKEIIPIQDSKNQIKVGEYFSGLETSIFKQQGKPDLKIKENNEDFQKMPLFTTYKIRRERILEYYKTKDNRFYFKDL